MNLRTYMQPWHEALTRGTTRRRVPVTAQVKDKIRLDSEELPLYAFPLPIDPNSPLAKQIKFVKQSTALYRGYVALWSIHDDKLYLSDLRGFAWVEGDGTVRKARKLKSAPWADAAFRGWPTDGGGPPIIDLQDIYGADGPVLAEWATGPLHVFHGRKIGYGGAFGAQPSHYRRLEVKRGQIVGDRIIANDRPGLAPPTDD
jgi:hypothetical protein